MQKYVINKREVVYRIISGEAVMLKIDNSYYYSLNEVGTKIWKWIGERRNTDEILGLLKKEYQNITEKQLKNDLFEFVKTLEKEKLIITSI